MYEIRLTRNAENDLRALDARWRTGVLAGMREHLSHQPTMVSKSRIKKLRELRLPRYRLRVGEIRIYYDVGEDYVMVHGIVPKDKSIEWLKVYGIPDDHGTTKPS